MKNLIIEKQEREAQASPLQKREDTAISSQDINKILETGNSLILQCSIQNVILKSFQ